LIVRPYPRWEPPEIDEWDDGYPSGYGPRCFPLAAVALGTVGIVGALALCSPRRYCRPRFFYGGYAGGCRPYLSCSPTFICYPRTCYPFAG
jgi:hypothetical protein